MHELIIDKCELVSDPIDTIGQYFQKITSRDEFKKEENKMIADAITMRLQVIGENIKKITKLNPSFFNRALQPDIDPIIRFRDFISHHYEKLDNEIVFDICKYHLPKLKKEIEQVLDGERRS